MQQGISLSRKGIEVSACKKLEEGMLLRIWEQSGVSGNVTATLPEGFNYTLTTPVNLRGEEIGKSVSVVDNQLSVELGAYAPASFILK